MPPTEIMKELGKRWSNLPAKDKKHYTDDHEARMAEYEVELEEYEKVHGPREKKSAGESEPAAKKAKSTKKTTSKTTYSKSDVARKTMHSKSK